jgi:serine/threonine protein kinase
MASGCHAHYTMDAGETILNRYQLRRCIGRGARGAVYEALDTLLGDPVALKILAPGAFEPEGARERLLEEVRLARRVTHANVCRVLEFGISRSGEPGAAAVPFITMELLTGETLAERLERVGRLEPAAAREILLRVLAGLGAIHGAKIVHGHLNPEHVFLCRDDRKVERVVVMSFGLARTIEAASGCAPAFATDVRAAGDLLFEMLKPARERASRPPLEPLLHAPSGLLPGLALVWDTVVLGCLERAAKLEDHGRPHLAPVEGWHSQRSTGVASSRFIASGT